ncbi:MAG: hypothetical protein CSA21_00955 [Deltaproteobacteria bacterium]|nr:MAG: hypothetical protein CSA21_00955 [Deltaproteobacteria bacterium]
MQLTQYSFGTGDRFGRQGSAQLEAVNQAKKRGVDIAIVWNKSHREHTIVGTSPADVRQEADKAVKEGRWQGAYYVDADHIGMNNVDDFLVHSDFFTLDVADFIGEKAEEAKLDAFVRRHHDSCGALHIEGLSAPLRITKEIIRHVAEQYLFAVERAAEIYRYIESKKGAGQFITEVSMDETETPQTPEELLFILAALGEQDVPAQTIAPKFTGRFNKGVDYAGDIEQFTREFNDDVCVIRHAVERYHLPAGLKLSVHSGSDKFSLYPGIRKAIEAHHTGVHIKTAGTTWLEELIGLAEAGAPLPMVHDIYAKAYERFTELCLPYATVIDIDRDNLPTPQQFRKLDGREVARTIRHDATCPDYNPNVRQLLHVGYKIAAELGESYLKAVEEHQAVVGKHVCSNLFDKHLRPLFL